MAASGGARRLVASALRRGAGPPRVAPFAAACGMPPAPPVAVGTASAVRDAARAGVLGAPFARRLSGAAALGRSRLSGLNMFQLSAAATDKASAPASAASPPAEPMELPTSDESEKLLRVRHSCAHIMAMAVQRIYKDAQVTVGPWTERGFFYDFDIKEPVTDKDLKKIRKEMQKIVRADMPFVKEEVSAAEARTRIKAQGEPYKLEILDSILARTPEAPITIYHIGEEGDPKRWWDLCAGPHVERTGDIAVDGFDLESVAGAYWRGDESKAMLQRLYGTAWDSKAQLDAYYHLKAEAARRDHRKIGADLDLFSIQQEAAGGGLVFWHPKGALVRHQIETFWKDLHLQRGYNLVYSPHIAKLDLWKTSGHYDFYGENMYDQMKVEDETYQLKPMNCPFHVAVYKNGYYSYRDLPVRLAELGTVYRYERSGTMHGLFRVRGFTQDDAHIFCLPEQVKDEICGVLDLVEEVLSTYGFTKYEINLSTRPEKSVGDNVFWKISEDALVEALKSKGWSYAVDAGGGAFYGPKIDIKIQDAIGRKWQCSTVQLDYNLPARFDMEYVDSNAEKQRPIMIHRAIFGSIERFFGILVENYAGAFPLWLAPEQVRLLMVNSEVEPYAREVAAAMRAAGVRVEIKGNASIAKLVRNAQQQKVPVACIIGKKEVEEGTLSVRLLGGIEVGALGKDEVLSRVVKGIASKSDF
uniref:threonine--tRNA ligase n=1 Tax=Chlamydomonas euryale TaxID=1486919 RepID=A0A7R9VNR4_9CHLO|mmetsp:Transcript_39955/g.118959  ORF Transcript_39955/g.118959 Transcript_39955/m.118959 type:complete len:699 (+) Transcript_39955:3-2099(+)